MIRFIFFILTLVPTIIFATTFQAKKNRVYINELSVFEYKTKKDGLYPYQRANSVVATLRRISHKGKVNIVLKKREAVIYIDNNAITRINQAEAHAHGKSIKLLAQLWADNIRRAYSMPRVILKQKSVQIPLGYERALSISGRAAHKVKVLANDHNIAEVVPVGNNYKILAHSIGKTTVSVSHKNEEQLLNVHVMPIAAQIPNYVQAHVMGRPCSAKAVKEAIYGAVHRSIKSTPNAKVNFSKIRTSHLHPQQFENYLVKTNVKASNALTAEKIININVKNSGIFRQQEKLLWYCNFPENIVRPGLISATELHKNMSLRALYHHCNVSNGELVIQVTLHNNSNKAAQVALMAGDGEPNSDPVRVGFAAGVDFMKSWMQGIGEIIEIPPYSVLPVSIRKLYHKQTMSGIAYIHLMPNGPDSLTIVAEAIYPRNLNSNWKTSKNSGNAWKICQARKLNAAENKIVSNSKHLYANPFKKITATYEVGSDFAFIRIGQKPIENLGQTELLDGNFGVFYNVDAQIVNPTSEPINIDVSFEASAGYSSGVFIVNGKFIKASSLPSKHSFLLRTFRMLPRQTTKVNIMTIPLSGSSYPATIVIRPRDNLLAMKQSRNDE